MVAFWIELPMTLRLVLLFLFGLLAGAFANRSIYQWSIAQLPCSPWMRKHPKASPRQWYDYLPVIGWWTLRRDSKVLGKWFWLRPMAIEIALGLVFVAFYQWTIQGGQYPSVMPARQVAAVAAANINVLHGRYLVHLLLIVLMTIATFIDFDERIIPDQVTVFGALGALTLVCVFPTVRLPIFPSGSWSLLSLTSPNDWPPWLQATEGLWCGLACYVGWCLAIWPKLWETRYGYLKAVKYLWASMIAAPRSNQRPDLPPRSRAHVLFMIAITLLGSAAVVGGWVWGGEHWTALLTALVGMAFGGGMIWAVRIVGGAALRAEAMGFGDVTLMAMIGAFLGWQPALLIFFCAPFTSLVIAIAQKIFTGESHIAFGPYLCAATVIVLLWWGDLWSGYAAGIFSMGWFIPQMLLALLILMGGMLMGLRFLREAREQGEPSDS